MHTRTNPWRGWCTLLTMSFAMPFSAMAQDSASAPEEEPRLMTIDDLRRALQGGELAATGPSRADDTESVTEPIAVSETAASVESVTSVDAANSTPQSNEPKMTLQDLARALGGEATTQTEEAGNEVDLAGSAVSEGSETDVEMATVLEETPNNNISAAPDRVDVVTAPTVPETVLADEDSALGDAPQVASTSLVPPVPDETPDLELTSIASPAIGDRRASVDSLAATSDLSRASSFVPATAYRTDASKWNCLVTPRRPQGYDTAGQYEVREKISVYFTSGGHVLTPQGVEAIRARAGDLRALAARGEKIKVLGYADPTGNEVSNVILSLQRAYNTKACIMELTGLDADALEVSGHGSFSPVLEPPQETAAGNRRVDVLAASVYQRRFEAAFTALNR